LWAVNPEAGFFGVAPGTNSKTNPSAMATIQKNTIFTNVLLKKDFTVWWEDSDEPAPSEGIDWMGKPWKPGVKDEKGGPVLAAHPNSRFTVPASQCPSISFRMEHHHGVPISAIIFGGRRAHVAPLVYESFSWQHGVYVGATMASERTAAQFGKQGEVRRDPMAMLPFCGYHMGDYFAHWLDVGKRLQKIPKIFHVNWFRVDDNGKFLWPGYGENLRVLEWILDRCNSSIDAQRTPIGYVPTKDSLDMTGLNVTPEILKKLLHVDRFDWLQEMESQKQFLETFGDRLPKELWEEWAAQNKRLQE
jgi:phosphoenolpyruvate carboxykinase (GTP)